MVLPLHPRTRFALEREKLFNTAQQRLRLIEPVGYLDMVMLEKNARLVATDSEGAEGGVLLPRSCVTLRDETEWVELVELGWNRVVPPQDEKRIAEALYSQLNYRGGRDADPYGSGDAAGKIVKCLTGGMRP